MSWLGTVSRDYDGRFKDLYYEGERYCVPPPLHRHDDSVTYMRPDEHDRMEVVAECGKHYVMQPRADLFAGIAAPCDRPHSNGGRNLL